MDRRNFFTTAIATILTPFIPKSSLQSVEKWKFNTSHKIAYATLGTLKKADLTDVVSVSFNSNMKYYESIAKLSSDNDDDDYTQTFTVSTNEVEV